MDGQLSILNVRGQYYLGTQHCGLLGAGRAAALNLQTFYFQNQLSELFMLRLFSNLLCKHNARYIRTLQCRRYRVFTRRYSSKE